MLPLTLIRLRWMKTLLRLLAPMFLMKTSCSVIPPPPHFGAWRFRGLFRQGVLEGTCLPILWWNLFDLGRFWEFLADLGIVFLVVDKINLVGGLG